MKTASLKMAVLVAIAALTAPSIGSAQYYPGDYRYDDRRSEYDGRYRPVYSDRAIRGRVLASINETLGWRARFVEVYVNNGVVTLAGRVVSERDRLLAREVADSVGGVRAVRARNLYATGRNRY